MASGQFQPPRNTSGWKLRDREAAVASQTTLSLPSDSIARAGVPSALGLCVVQRSLGESCWELSWAMELLLHELLPSLVFQELSWFSPMAEPLGQLVPPQPGTKVFFCNGLRYKCYLKSGFILKAKPRAHPQLGQGCSGATSEEFSYLTG